MLFKIYSQFSITIQTNFILLIYEYISVLNRFLVNMINFKKYKNSNLT